MKTTSCEFWLAVDENGDFDIAIDKSTAFERYADTVGSDTGCMHSVKLTLHNVPVPGDVCVTGTFPALPTPSVNLTLSIDKIERV